MSPPPGISGCAGVGIEGLVLRGDPDSSSVAWADVGGARMAIQWPPGTVARFEPSLVMVAADGSVIARDGDPIPED